MNTNTIHEIAQHRIDELVKLKKYARDQFSTGLIESQIKYWNELKLIMPKPHRFRIIDPSERTQTSYHSSLEQVVLNLKSKDRDLNLQNYIVEDIWEDMVIDADELINAWDSGERPEDLQMF